MLNASTLETLSPPIRTFMTTGASEDRVLTYDDRHREKNQALWQQLIDNHLIEWGKAPGSLVDEDLMPPLAEILNKACDFARKSRDKNYPAPIRVVPDGEGGVAFEWQAGRLFIMLHLRADRVVTKDIFHDCKLIATDSVVLQAWDE